MAAKGDKGMAILIGGPAKSGAAGGGVPAESYDEDLEMASGDLIAAVGSGDAAGVASAFKAMHEICARSG